MMTKKNIKSIFLISLIGVIIWLLGFILILVLDFKNSVSVSKGWLIMMFVGTVVVSVVKNMKNDER